MGDFININLRSETEATKALDLINAIAEDLPVGAVELGDWIKTTVTLPDLHSEITPPYMEAFLEMQRQLYQFVAFVNANAADSKLLSVLEKEELQIHVRVSEGSSKLEAEVGAALKKAIPALIRKMNGRQVAAILIALALIFGSSWAFRAWLEQQREIQLSELKTRDHVEALKALTLANASQQETFRKLLTVLETQGPIGERALVVLQATNDALLRAASKSSRVEINGQALEGGDAQILRAATRKPQTERLSIEQVRVVSADTGDERNLQFVLMDGQNNQHRVSSAESLFSATERPRIFEALANRQPIWVELLFREADGEIKSVTFLRLSDPDRAAIR